MVAKMFLSPVKPVRLVMLCLLLLSIANTASAQIPTYTITICSGEDVAFEHPGHVSGELYSWSLPAVTPGGALGSSVSAGSMQAKVFQTPSHLLSTPVLATYTVTTSLGVTFQLQVTIKPTPALGNITIPVCDGRTFSYIPIGVPANTTYTWTVSSNPNVTGNIPETTPQSVIGGHILNNPATASADVVYTITPSAGACVGNPFLITVRVHPTPVLNNQNVAATEICSGLTYGFTPQASPVGTNISWSRVMVTGVDGSSTGSGAINDLLKSSIDNPVTTTYQFSLNYNGCTNTQQIDVLVKPMPKLTSSLFNLQDVCSGNSFTYTPASDNSINPVFTWERFVNADINAGAPGMGTGDINDPLSITSGITNNRSVVYRITTKDNSTGCIGQPELMTVYVRPIPAVADQVTTVCAGNTFFVSPDLVPEATTYTWTINSIAGAVTGATPVSVESYFIGQRLNGTGSVEYLVRPTNGACVGANFRVTVNVNTGVSVPLITNNAPDAICSETQFSFEPATTATNADFSWKRFYMPGITGSLGSGTTGDPDETLTMGSGYTTPITVYYAFTTKDNVSGCSNTQLIPLTVKPLPRLASAVSAGDVCSGDNISYTPISVVSNTTYTWSRPVTANISNSAGSGNGAISESLTNIASAVVTVNYQYTLKANGCEKTQSVQVKVHPIPEMSVSLNGGEVCSGQAFTYSPASVTNNTSFMWKRDVVGSIANAASNGADNPNEVLINTSNIAVTVPYVYTLQTGIGCVNEQTVTVMVKPVPVIGNMSVNTCSDVPFTITPANVPAGTLYNWTAPSVLPLGTINGGTAGSAANITQTLQNISGSAATATYTITPSANGCVGNTFELQVAVAYVPQLTSNPTPAAICSNDNFSYQPVGNTSGTSFTWLRNAVAGISNPSATGVGNPNEILINTQTTTLAVTYSYTLNTPAGCVATQNVVVQVKPQPRLTSAVTTPICSGDNFSFVPQSTLLTGNTFSWTRSSISAINNGAIATGTDNISEILLNTTTSLVTVPYQYTVVNNGCSNTQTVTIDVKPTPHVVNQATSACNGAAFVINPGGVPSGTQYTWTLPVYTPNGAITGGSQELIPQSNISQVLSNTSSAAAMATYTVTPAANGCIGQPFQATVTVHIPTSLSSTITPPAVCSNTVFNYTPASNTPGTSFAWTRAVINGVSNPAASGTGNPGERLINITSDPITVTYTYAMNTPNSCIGIQQINVVVNPTPVLTSNLNPAAICSGDQFVYTPASATTGVSYAWVRPVLPFISNPQGNGGGGVNPFEVLVSKSNTTVSVPYEFTLTANGCTNKQTVTATVKPTPKIDNQQVAICANTAFNINPQNVPADTRYTWTLPMSNPSGVVAGFTQQSVPVANVGHVLTNASINAAQAVYTITPETDGCVGAPFAVTVTVTPAPVVANQLLQPVCSGEPFSFIANNVPSGTTYTWGMPVIGPVNSLAGGGPEPISQPRVSQILSSTNNLVDTAIYTVTPSAAGCVGNTFTVTVPVKPTPAIPHLRDTICTGAAFTVVPVPVPVNTLYTWTVPASAPANAITGGNARTVGAPAISQVLNNGSNEIADMVYTVTPATDGCVGKPFLLTVTVGIPLAKVADRETMVCSDAPFDATPNTTPPNTYYTWSTPTVTPLLSASGFGAAPTRQALVSQKIRNLTDQVDTLKYTVLPHNTGCTGNPFTVTVFVRPVPRAVISAKPVVCRYPKDTLTVSFVGQGPWSFDYDDNGVQGRITNITTSTYNWIVDAVPDLPQRLFTITRSADNACTDSIHTSTFTQKINPLPIGAISSKNGIYICDDKADSVYVVSSEKLTYQWMHNGELINPLITASSITTRAPGAYNAVLTNQFGCVDTAATPLTLYYILKPGMSFTNDIYCVNMPIQFTNLSDTAGAGPISWSWDFGNESLAYTMHASTVYPKGGKHHIQLRAVQQYCPATENYADTTLDIMYPIPAMRMPSVSAYRGEPTALNARDSANYRYQWLPTKGVDNPNISSPNFNFEVTQDYIIQLISPAGCITPDSMLVRVFDPNLVDIMVPKTFTPNGDGVNDILYPYLSGMQTFHYFKVFNRFGQLMFETKNKDIGWNGSMGGVAQPMAIYIWVASGIALDGTPVEKRGQVLLVR